MLSVCRRYIHDIHIAEELMLQGFMKVFTSLNSFQFNGSFEGWIRRIMVNHCISYLRKKEKLVFVESLPENPHLEETDEKIDAKQNAEFLQKIIDELPEGYKTVFMLFAVEGYKHKEIAETLGITENTSKSQLYKARNILKSKIKSQNEKQYGIQ